MTELYIAGVVLYMVNGSLNTKLTESQTESKMYRVR